MAMAMGTGAGSVQREASVKERFITSERRLDNLAYQFEDLLRRAQLQVLGLPEVQTGADMTATAEGLPQCAAMLEADVDRLNALLRAYADLFRELGVGYDVSLQGETDPQGFQDATMGQALDQDHDARRVQNAEARIRQIAKEEALFEVDKHETIIHHSLRASGRGPST